MFGVFVVFALAFAVGPPGTGLGQPLFAQDGVDQVAVLAVPVVPAVLVLPAALAALVVLAAVAVPGGFFGAGAAGVPFVLGYTAGGPLMSAEI